MKRFFAVAFVSLFALIGCGKGKPVILQPSMGQVIPFSGGGVGGFGQPVITVVIENDDPDVSISFYPPNPPGLVCQPSVGRAYCYAGQGGFTGQNQTIAIIADKGGEQSFVIVTLGNSFGQTTAVGSDDFDLE